MIVPRVPIPPETTPCKCCGATATPYGVVDFNKNCAGRDLGIAGVPIHYHRCPACRFIFTTAFDGLSQDEMQLAIYNDGYALVDPDYQLVRPQSSAAFLTMLFPAAKPPTLLDFGGGAGTLAGLLRDAGFPDVDTYDPFVAEHSLRPTRRYDCITCFEVAEHTTDPRGTFAAIAGLLNDPGLVILSTALQPPDIDRQGLSWWYAAPRNGHVSLYAQQSLLQLVQRLGFKLASYNDNFHLLFRTLPEFAKAGISVG